METTIVIALYGAALSTLVAGWNIYLWFSSGPNLKGIASSNMEILGTGLVDKNIYISFLVSNRGNADTTITHVGFQLFEGWLNYIRRKAAQTGLVTHPTIGDVVPKRLAPGGEFRGFMLQNNDFEEWSHLYRFYVCVWHSMSDKPLRIRLGPINKAEKKE